MPFPPNFDHVWDLTQPPDTQLANLLGQDIRNLKDDVMQRLSLLSGTFANRPTPEIVNATWGGAGFGLLYFSTDTGQIFQWNGAVWVDVSASFIQNSILNIQAFLPGVVGNSGTQTLFTYNLGAGVVGLNQGIRLTVGSLHTIGAFNVTYTVSLNGSVIDIEGPQASYIQSCFTIINTGAASGVSVNTARTLATYVTMAGLNWANAQTLLFSVTNLPNTDTVVPFIWMVELLR